MKTRRERLIWEAKQEEQLVDFIKAKDHVWNNKNSSFTNLRMRKKVFAEFAAKLGDDYTVKAVRERWTNIRNTYMHNLRRVEKTQRAAESLEDVYEPSWHLWERCQFMAGIRDDRPKQESSDELILNAVKVEESDTLFMDDDDFLSNAVAEQDDLEDPITLGALQRSSTAVLTSRKRHKSRDESACKRILDEAQGLIKSLQEHVGSEGTSKFTHISRHVADRLSKMKPYDAECASRRIMDVLALYSEFNPANPNKMMTGL